MTNLKFPNRVYSGAGDYTRAYFAGLAEAAASIPMAAIDAAAGLIGDVAKRGGQIYSCGNGGSAAIANHLVCDWLKGIRSDTSLRPKVHSLSANVEIITAVANDIGVERVFAYQLESLGHDGDLLIAISSSGTSPNIVAAVECAHERGMQILALTGFTGGRVAELANISIHVPCDNYGIVEDLHQSIMHILAQYLRQTNLVSPAAFDHIRF